MLSSYVNTTDGGTAGVAGGGARHVRWLASGVLTLDGPRGS